MSDSKNRPIETSFASFFVYSPRPVPGESDAGAKSRRLVRSIKNEARRFAERWNLAQFVRDNLDPSVRERYLGCGHTLVPVPGHAPLKDQNSRWPARELCEEFVQAGLGSLWLPLLERSRKVNKAAFSPPGKRPTYSDHLESLRVNPQLGASESITVLDDVITRGTTVLAAIQRLRESYPGAQIQSFALLRTMSNVALAQVILPAEGTVILQGDTTWRRP